MVCENKKRAHMTDILGIRIIFNQNISKAQLPKDLMFTLICENLVQSHARTSNALERKTKHNPRKFLGQVNNFGLKANNVTPYPMDTLDSFISASEKVKMRRHCIHTERK